MAELRRPSFSEPYPRTAELDALVDAFARGDYARVRAEAPRLRDAPEAAVGAAAQELLDRTEPDPLAVKLLGIAAALLLVLTGWWIVEGKPPPGALPTSPQIEHAR